MCLVYFKQTTRLKRRDTTIVAGGGVLLYIAMFLYTYRESLYTYCEILSYAYNNIVVYRISSSTLSTSLTACTLLVDGNMTIIELGPILNSVSFFRLF